MVSVLVTGSADGIGRETAATLVAQGHRVVLHARSDERAADALAAVPGAAGVLVGDLASLARTRELATAAGAFDVVIHNAGIGGGQPAPEITEDGLERIFQVNVLAPYVLTALLPWPARLVYLTSGLEADGVPRRHPAGRQHPQVDPARPVLGEPPRPAGLTQVPGERSIFPTLTVDQNLAIARKSTRYRAWSYREVFEIFTALEHLRWRESENLSGGEMQMVAIARAVSADHRVVIMDEPTSALTQSEIKELFSTIRRLKTRSVALVYISHRMEELFQIGEAFAQGGEVRAPMAVCVIGGLITSTLLSLIVVPAAYTVLHVVGDWFARRFRRGRHDQASAAT